MSPRVTSENPTIFKSATESEMGINVKLYITWIRVLTNEVVKLQTKLDQLKESLESIMKQQLDKSIETNTQVGKECRQYDQILSEKIQKLENGQAKLQSKMETQKDFFWRQLQDCRHFFRTNFRLV